MTTLCTVTRHGHTSRHAEGGTVTQAIQRALTTWPTATHTEPAVVVIERLDGRELREYEEWR